MELVRKVSGIWRRENLDDVEGHEGTNLLLFDLTHNTTGAESAAGGIWSALNRARPHPSPDSVGFRNALDWVAKRLEVPVFVTPDPKLKKKRKKNSAHER